ncbi:MAG: carboxypeptidase regulatory-like domain-containing protein [Euryarchaeota archaeon]|nr:carboxypeptidase regulatory-like domain-containing protein [Euryarchaeota archaeon]
MRPALRACAALAVSLAILAIASPLSESAPPPYLVMGFISDAFGNPLEGANVTILNQRTGERLYSTSDPAGGYIVDLSINPTPYKNGDGINVTARLAALQNSAYGTVNSSQAQSVLNVTLYDTMPPAIYHAPPGSIAVWQDLNLTCTALDDMRVQYVTVYYIEVGGSAVRSLPMNMSAGTRQNGTWCAAMPDHHTAGNMSYWFEAGDLSGNSAATGAYALTVKPGSANEYVITAPSSVIAGQDFSIDVRVADSFWNTVTDFNGTAYFYSDAMAALPPQYTFVPSDNGRRQFAGLRLYTAPRQSFVVDTMGPGPTSRKWVDVSPSQASMVAWSPERASILAGIPFQLSLGVVDMYGNPTTYPYPLDVLLTSTSAQGSFAPSQAHVPSNTQSAPVTYNDTAIGTPLLAAQPTDPVIGEGTANITVLNASTAMRWSVTPAQATVQAGKEFPFNLTLIDPFGNPSPVATATRVNLTTTSKNGKFFPQSRLDPEIDHVDIGPGNSSATFAYWDTAATTAPIAIAASNGSDVATGTSRVTVAPDAAGWVLRTGLPETAIAGVKFDVRIDVTDAYRNPIANFSGIVNISAPDPLSSNLSYQFAAVDMGSHTFSVALFTAGIAELWIDAWFPYSNNIEHYRPSVKVVHNVASKLVVAAPREAEAGEPFSFSVSPADDWDNRVTNYTGTVRFSSGGRFPAALPAPYDFLAPDEGFRHFDKGAALFSTLAQRVIASADAPKPMANYAEVWVNDTVAPDATVQFPLSAYDGDPIPVTVGARDRIAIARVQIVFSADGGDPLTVSAAQTSGNMTTGIGNYSAELRPPSGTRKITFHAVVFDGYNNATAPTTGNESIEIIPRAQFDTWTVMVIGAVIAAAFIAVAVVIIRRRRRKGDEEN